MTEWKEEYREAGQNFREGFKLMFEISKGFITVNTFLLAAYAVVRSFHDPHDPNPFSLSTLLVCIVGVLTSVGFGVAHWRISEYLRGFVKRAAAIETDQSFQLYSEVDKYNAENDSSLFNNVKIPLAGMIIIGLVWLILFLVSWGIVNVHL